MKVKHVVLFLVLLATYGCSVDYDIEKSEIKEPDCIIVNSYLNPSKLIQIQLYESRSTGNKYVIRGLMNANVTLRENNEILFNGSVADSLLTLNYYPKSSASYSIEVSHSDLPSVSAQTHIPKAISATTNFTYQAYWDVSKFLIYLNHFKYNQADTSALWITAYKLYENDSPVQYNEIYASNVAIDKANSVAGMSAKNETVGSIYYNGFLRVKYKNIPLLTELIITPNYVYDGTNNYPESKQTKIQVRIITASLEYDKYNKTLYDQKFMIIYDNDISSVFYQPKGVYNNIKNGLGIFAGMNEVNYVFDLPKSPDDDKI